MLTTRATPGSRWAAAIAAFFLLALVAAPATGHDIPNEILLSGFVKPEGKRLHFLVRIPLVLFLTVNFPKRGPGYLDLEQADARMPRAIEAVTREIGFYEGDRRLVHERARARISQPSEAAFGSYDEALAHIEGPPLPARSNVFWNQGYLDLAIEYRIESDRSAFTMNFEVGPGLPGVLKMTVRFMPPEGETLAYVVHGGYGRLVLNPRWYHAAATFVQSGFVHILDGIDHLLFLLCLVLPFRLRQFWRLAGVVTAFTVAHSITLIAAALGAVPSGKWFPPVVEVLIAVSILYMAVENVILALRQGKGFDALRWRWLITAGFGLVHGFGFSFALRENLQFAGTHLLVSLLSFNVGVELGQILVLLLILPATALLFRTPSAARFGIVITSVVVAHTAWHWMVARAQSVRVADWPELGSEPIPALAASALVIAVLAAAAWLALRYTARRRSGSERGPS